MEAGEQAIKFEYNYEIDFDFYGGKFGDRDRTIVYLMCRIYYKRIEDQNSVLLAIVTRRRFTIYYRIQLIHLHQRYTSTIVLHYQATKKFPLRFLGKDNTLYTSRGNRS